MEPRCGSRRATAERRYVYGLPAGRRRNTSTKVHFVQFSSAPYSKFSSSSVQPPSTMARLRQHIIWCACLCGAAGAFSVPSVKLAGLQCPSGKSPPELDTVYLHQGFTQDGRPWFKSTGLRVRYIYFDSSCGSDQGYTWHPRWLLGTSKPDPNATSNLDLQPACSRYAEYFGEDLNLMDGRNWRLYCGLKLGFIDGIKVRVSLTLPPSSPGECSSSLNQYTQISSTEQHAAAKKPPCSQHQRCVSGIRKNDCACKDYWHGDGCRFDYFVKLRGVKCHDQYNHNTVCFAQLVPAVPCTYAHAASGWTMRGWPNLRTTSR